MAHLRRVVAGAVAASFVLTLAVPARAAAPSLAAAVPLANATEDRKAKVDRELAKLREDLEGTADDLVEAAVALKRAKLRLSDARAELAEAQAELEKARQRDLELAQRLEAARIGAEKARRRLADSEAAEKASRTEIGRIAAETYRSATISTLSVALEAQSPEEFSAQMAVAGAALRVQNGAISRLAVKQAEGRAERAKLDAIEAQVGELKRLSEVYVRQRTAAEEKASAAEREVDALVDGRAAALVTIKKRQAAEKERLRKLAREQEKLKKLLAEQARKARQRGGGAPGGSGSLSYPVNGPVTSGFGWRMHPILHYRRLHTGTDFGVVCGTPVHAARSGTVILAGWAGGYGNRVVVDHGLVGGVGLATTYNHLTRIVVGGGHVDRGQVIAYSGTTGSSTGCHLHFEVLANGVYVDPMGWL